MVRRIKSHIQRARLRRRQQVRAVRWTVGAPPRAQEALVDPLAG